MGAFRQPARIACKADRLAYPIRDEIPVMLENEARKLSLEEYDALIRKAARPPQAGDDVVV